MSGCAQQNIYSIISDLSWFTHLMTMDYQGLIRFLNDICSLMKWTCLVREIFAMCILLAFALFSTWIPSAPELNPQDWEYL